MLVGLGGGSAQLFVEDVFSTYLYVGNGSTQTITNGINLSGQGGMVWTKARSNTRANGIIDTTRGLTKWLSTNTANGEGTYVTTITSVSSTGFTIGNDIDYNENGTTMASWTFREAPKFFDVVTTTSTSLGEINIFHTLGVKPGCVFIKRIDSSGDWTVWHRSADQFKYLTLNSSAAETNMPGGVWADAQVSTFYAYGSGPFFAANAQYVVYLFAHVPGSDGIIQCGSYAGTGLAGQIATLGWEPQWVMIKATNTATDWDMYDTMRGMTTLSDGSAKLRANTSGAESGPLGGASSVFPTATGFGAGGGIAGVNQSGGNYIYVAIRRGPMRTPTLGTSVYFTNTTSAGGDLRWPQGVPDLIISSNRTSAANWQFADRLRGLTSQFPTFNNNAVTTNPFLSSSNTNAEATANCEIGVYSTSSGLGGDQYGLGIGPKSASLYSGWFFRRAPGFFDEVCYTGTGVAGTKAHSLGVAPELIIIKPRSSTGSWIVGTTFGATTFTEAVLNSSNAGFFIAYDNLINAAPTSTTFSVGTSSGTNGSGSTYVAYLFASAPGVSKVGSYTGNGSSQTINCAFTTGARYVLIKRTDSTGDWYVWDSARGIVAGNDPYLALNTTAAEVTSNDSVDTDSTGFVVNQVAASNINVNAATYIFLAIA
jgi:hypothetical protein